MKRQANGKFASKAGEVVRTETREFHTLNVDKAETFIAAKKVSCLNMEICFDNMEVRETGVINRTALITQHFMEDMLALFEKHMAIQTPAVKEINDLDTQARRVKEALYK